MSSFYVRAKSSGKWSVYEEIHVNTKKSQVKVIEQSYPSLGINPSWTIEQVKSRIKLINKENKLERKAATETARKLAVLDEYDKVFFPEELTNEFLEHLRASTAGTDDYWVRLLGGFKFAKKMVLKLKIKPHQYADKAPFIYRYFSEAKISVDYSQEILKTLNAWGRYVAKHQGSFFEPVPNIPKQFRKNIAREQRTKTGVRTESEHMQLSHLVKLESQLPTEEYSWMYVSFWLGLRPSEVDRESGKPHLLPHPTDKSIKVLEVNQVKIESEDEDAGYKYVPILYPEQKRAVELLKSGNLKRPNPKKLKDVTGENIDTYSARKGFVDLMQALGQRIEDAAMWMGHKDLKTTLKHYKNHSNVPFTKV